MPIQLQEYAQYHPTRLTRQSDSPVISGTYTLEALRTLYGGASEIETLLFAAMRGQAFLKKLDGCGYTAFNPIAGETSDLPLDNNPDDEGEGEGEAGEGEAGEGEAGDAEAGDDNDDAEAGDDNDDGDGEAGDDNDDAEAGDDNDDGDSIF